MRIHSAITVILVCLFSFPAGNLISDNPASGKTGESALKEGLEGTISLIMEETPALQIITYIEKISKVPIKHTKKAKDILQKRVTVKADKITVIAALKQVCSQIQASVEIKKDHVLIDAAPSVSKKEGSGKQDENDIVATVNSDPVTRKEINSQLNVYYPFLEKNTENTKLKEQIYKEVMKRAILMKVRNQFIKKSLQDRKISKDEIDKNVKDIQEKIAQNPTFKDFTEFLSRFGFKDKEEYIQKVVISDLKYKKFLNSLIAEKDVRDIYDKKKNDLKQIRISHIYLKTVVDKKKNEEIKARAEELRKKIVKGTGFAETARKHSDAESAQNGGDIGYITVSSKQVNKTFLKAALALKTNEIGPVVAVSTGFHIITVTDIKDSFEELEEGLRDAMIMQLQARHINQLVRKSDIKILDEKYKQLVKEGK